MTSGHAIRRGGLRPCPRFGLLAGRGQIAGQEGYQCVQVRLQIPCANCTMNFERPGSVSAYEHAPRAFKMPFAGGAGDQGGIQRKFDTDAL